MTPNQFCQQSRLHPTPPHHYLRDRIFKTKTGNIKTNTMVAAKIKDLILNRIDFPDQEVLVAVEKLATSAGTLASAGDQFDDVNPGDSGDTVATGALNLADAFADVATPDKNALIKKAFNDIYSAATPEQESAGEALFSAALDFDIAANELNDLLAQRLATTGDV